MRIFCDDEGPIDTLLQLAAGPVRDGDLVGKGFRDELVKHGWAARCHGWNMITDVGENAVRILRLRLRRPAGPEAPSASTQAAAPLAPGTLVEWDGHFGMRYRVVTVDRGFAWLRVNEHDGLGVTVPVPELEVVSE